MTIDLRELAKSLMFAEKAKEEAEQLKETVNQLELYVKQLSEANQALTQENHAQHNRFEYADVVKTSQLDALRQQNKDCHSLVNDYLSDIGRAMINSTLYEKINHLGTELMRRSHDPIGKKYADNAQALARITFLERMLMERDARIAVLEESLHKEEVDYSGLYDTVDGYRDTIEDLEEKLDVAKNSFYQQDKQIRDLQERLIKSEERGVGLLNRLQNYQDENDNQRLQIKEFFDKNEISLYPNVQNLIRTISIDLSMSEEDSNNTREIIEHIRILMESVLLSCGFNKTEIQSFTLVGRMELVVDRYFKLKDELEHLRTSRDSTSY